MRQRLFAAWLCIGVSSFFVVSVCAGEPDVCMDDDACCLPITNKGVRGDDCSHTEFAVRQVVYNNTYQHNLGLFWWYHEIICEVAQSFMAVQVTPYYQTSRNPKKLARFFLPCCTTGNVSVCEDGLGDIGSLWLSLIAADNKQYEGFFSLCPKTQVVNRQ